MINPDEKAPKTDEFMVQYEQQLGRGLCGARHGDLQPGDRPIPAAEHQAAVRGVQHSRSRTRIRVRTACGQRPTIRGTSITFYDYARSVRGPGQPAADALQRSARRPQLQVDGVRASRGGSPTTGSSGPPTARRGSTSPSRPPTTTAFLDPNAEINAGQPDWEWGARASGSYHVPGGTSWCRATSSTAAGIRGRARSSSRAARTSPAFWRASSRWARVASQHQPPRRPVPEGPVASGRPGGSQLRANVFNLLNTQVATSIKNLSGPISAWC